MQNLTKTLIAECCLMVGTFLVGFTLSFLLLFPFVLISLISLKIIICACLGIGAGLAIGVELLNFILRI